MPVCAARLADVLVGDADPLEALGLGDHLLEQLTVLLLDVGAVAEDGADVGDPRRKTVPHLLELGDPEEPGAPGRCDVPLDPLAWEGRGEELRELALQP